MTNLKSAILSGIAAAALLTVAACGSSSGGDKKGSAVEDVSNLDALVAAAKKEGQVVLYSSNAQAINDGLAKAFKDKYGITVTTTKLLGAEVGTRFQAEASAGKVLADNLMPSCTEEKMFREIVEKGWATPASELKLPALEKDSASDLLTHDGVTFKAFLLPVVMGYNTDKLSGDELPSTWEDLLDPKYKGKIVMVDPKAAIFYYHFLQWLSDEYGEDFLTKLAAQDLQWADSATARNQLSAGQASINIPTFRSAMQDSVDSGAPVDSLDPDVTTATEICLSVSSPKSAPHPNAARLFAYFMTTPEGAAAVESVPGVVSPYGDSDAAKSVRPLPAKYDEKHLRQLVGLD